GSVALLFLMTVAQRLLNTFLPRYEIVRRAEHLLHVPDEGSDMDDFDGLFKRQNIPGILKSMLVAIIVFAVAGGISLFFKDSSSQTIVVILTITTLGLAASFIRKVNELKISFPLGMYFIIIFCLALSSMASLREMFQLEFLQLFLYVLWVV